MNIIKKTILSLLLTFFAVNSSILFAEESVNSSAMSKTIELIEKSIVEVNNSNFSSANLHLKAARTSSDEITGDKSVLEKAGSAVIQAQIKTKQGNVKQSITLLNKALDLYKSLSVKQ